MPSLPSLFWLSLCPRTFPDWPASWSTLLSETLQVFRRNLKLSIPVSVNLPITVKVDRAPFGYSISEAAKLGTLRQCSYYLAVWCTRAETAAHCPFVRAGVLTLHQPANAETKAASRASSGQVERWQRTLRGQGDSFRLWSRVRYLMGIARASMISSIVQNWDSWSVHSIHLPPVVVVQAIYDAPTYRCNFMLYALIRLGDVKRYRCRSYQGCLKNGQIGPCKYANQASWHTHRWKVQDSSLSSELGCCRQTAVAMQRETYICT